ncbi:lysophosphatidylcholine acyltransferase 2 [Ambystoma mexicanum]|uniref:lysophosphatidylcholine acyltransferase 2 n=1 Tax=Ambystoma mexicanum TaxID=8296 RepID=UPI0037E8FD5C
MQVMAQQPRLFSHQPLPRQFSFIPPPVLNPFVQDKQLTTTQKLRMCLLGIILLPLRAIFIGLIMLLAWPFAVLATCSCLEPGSKPIAGWQRKIVQNIIGSFGRCLFFLMGFFVKVKGQLATPVEAPIIAVAPHSTFFDAVACIVAGLPSTVSRSENVSAPLFGRVLRAMQPVLVSRTDPDSRKKTINDITKRATSGGEWPQVLIFPEGTCTNRSCLITFKPGAFIPGVPVQPVLLRYPNKLDTVTWTWQGYSFIQALTMTLSQLFTNVEVEFMPVYVPTKKDINDPILFANNVRSQMATALDVPVTDHTFEDCRLMISAGELTLPMEAGLVEFTKISKKLNLKWDSVRTQLNEFAEIADASKGGRIGIEEFAKFLKLPVSDVLRELFSLFDRNGDGTIDFREYVIGVSILCNPANTEDTIQMAFKLFDVDNDGSITENEFSALLRSSLGVPDLNVSKLFQDMDADKSGKIHYYEFRDFALKHPVYAKLFTTYLEHQRYVSYKIHEQPAVTRCTTNVVTPVNQEDCLNTSDKKED